jgi:hypothetical protein
LPSVLFGGENTVREVREPFSQWPNFEISGANRNRSLENLLGTVAEVLQATNGASESEHPTAGVHSQLSADGWQ